MSELPNRWPKQVPLLTPAEVQAREQFMRLWHELLPKRYGLVERFNHGSVAGFPIRAGIKTLEIGAGLGEHSKFENLKIQEYHCLEFREEFCTELRKAFPADRVHLADVEEELPWKDGEFDRIVAVHVLEHLRNLPAALANVRRVLKDDGVFDVVLPCEGGMAYTLARRISAQRFFEKTFKMSYEPIIRNEHVNVLSEILELLPRYFRPVSTEYFPLRVPVIGINLCMASRWVK